MVLEGPSLDWRQSRVLAPVPEGYQPWLVADAAQRAGEAVFIARDDAQAATMIETMAFLLPQAAVFYYPAWDCLPFDRASASARLCANRLHSLYQLSLPRGETPRVLVTTVNAVVQRVLPPALVAQQVRHLVPGDALAMEDLAQFLVNQGYHRVDTVAELGDFALRGGLMDVYPPGDEVGYRLDFFGDEIETIRTFDPHDQRSIGVVEQLTLLPVSEAPLSAESIRRFRQGYLDHFGGSATVDPLYQAVSEGRRFSGQDHWLPLFCPQMTTVIEGYCAPSTPIIMDGQGQAAARARFDLIADHHQARLADPHSGYRPLPVNALYLAPEEWDALCARVTLAARFPMDDADAIDCGVRPAHDFAPERQAAQAASRSVFDGVKAYFEARPTMRFIIACYSLGSRERLAHLLRDHGITSVHLIDDAAAMTTVPLGEVGLIIVPLENGFECGALLLLTEQDILGERIVRRRKSNRRADAFIQELSTLTPGDLVVHFDHGIGRYEGLQTLDIGGAPHDCLALTYAGNDRLYVPVENIDVLTRYGSDHAECALDKLGGVSWQSRRAKLKERIREIAAALLKTAALRHLRQAAALPIPVGVYEEFCARFSYAETEDQIKAIDDVLGDLASGKPMDRLVCGDVGFGKTEVALRAACVAAMNGMQVALICPTTLLARQHYTNFKARFSGLPLQVGHLSRLVGAAETAKTVAGLAEGTIDIVIGTHALLAKKIQFHRLGLVMVDEEQHFGVAHKERLKQLKADVHVLTLTATPIPRTLQMALTGLRELSLIATPPIDRLAVRTYIVPWDPPAIREALLREHFRGGQSFFVCPRIADLAECETFLKTHVPEVKAVIAHGQMPATDLEERMGAFYEHRYDVLLSTTIIESGLDIPNANTLIVYRADMFGLAQLYQIRGRVGRSKARGYAYLTTDANTPLRVAAERRLSVLSSLDELGAGFQLASHDLDIRGAGNLLGDEQSGHIREVGFELYQNMLEDALLAARAEHAGLEAQSDPLSPQITMGASILIPESYVPDLNLRMALYRRLSDLKNRADIDGCAAELIDRFGPLPQELRNLLLVIETKIHCRVAHIAKIDAGPRGALITFHGDQFPNVPGLITFVQDKSPHAKLRPDHKLVVTQAWQDPDKRLNAVLRLARALARIARTSGEK